MEPHLPFLLVRAVPVPEEREAFGRWFRHVHLRDVRRIPGFKSIHHAEGHDGSLIGLYTFRDAGGVQATLSSPEAAYARGTWEQWTPVLEELAVEVFVPMVPLPLYHSRN